MYTLIRGKSTSNIAELYNFYEHYLGAKGSSSEKER